MPVRTIISFILVVALQQWVQPGIMAQEAGLDTASIISFDGPFRVGSLMMDWTDHSRREPATPEPSDHRQVPVQIWYPIDPAAAGERAPYRPRVEAFRPDWGDEAVDFVSTVQTTWIDAASVSRNGPFPVLLFSHGWGSRSSSYGTLLSNLASQGYIVVGLNHPYMGKLALASGEVTEPMDSQFPNQAYANRFYADDVIFVLDQLDELNKNDPDGRFTGTIDMDRVAAGGHSSGFPAVSGAAVSDERIKALISFDAGVPRIVRQFGLDVPILLFRADSASYTDLFFRGKNVHPKGTIYDVDFFRVHRSDFYDLVISGTTHNSVYDQYLFTEDAADKQLSMRNHKIMDAAASAFLDLVLNGADTLLLDADLAPYTRLRVIKAYGGS